MFALYYRKLCSSLEKHFLQISKVLLFLGCTFLILLLAQPAQAQSIVFEDDFSGGFEKWVPTRDTGEYWSISNEALIGLIPLTYTISELVPADTYWDDDWHNIRYELDYMALSGGDKNISFHFENIHNWYEVHFNGMGMNVVRIQDSGFATWSVHKPLFLQNNVPYHFSLQLVEGTVSLTINSELVFEETDPTFNQNYGKIGLKVGTGSVAPTKVQIDSVKVTLLEDASARLGVTRFSQLDPLWREAEYDSASIWSPENPTIGAYGCALTSMVMILDYYNITHFPNEVPITPETLNAWLLAQPDGYIGEGLVNWLAVARLTRLVSEKMQTPKLEFSYVATSVIETLTTQLQTLKQPVVLAIPGHFLVADGVVPPPNPTSSPDFLIQDPAYEYQQFSQHEEQLQSLRIFTPSFTDLSYFLLTGEKPLENEALTNTVTLEPLEILHESSFLSNHDQDTSQTNTLEVYHVSKPEDGSYELTFSGELGRNYKYTLYSYTEDGEVSVHTLAGLYGSQPEKYTFQYSKTNVETLVPQNHYSTTHIQADLDAFWSETSISSHFLYYELSRIARFFDIYPNNVSALRESFTNLLETAPLTHIDTKTKRYLQAKIELI